MNKAELIQVILNDENSGVEFKRDDVANHRTAQELVALLNLEGGTVLLGVEDDGSITGASRKIWKSGSWNFAGSRLIRR